MPEPQEATDKKNTGVEENKSSKILDFFSAAVKEPKKEKIRPLTKVVIRRLPPRLTKEAFLEEFELPDHDYFCFVRGDLSMGQLAFSRAYVNFHKGDDIFVFKEKYDDYLLQDDQGREYHAVVEWAPVQKIPKKNSQKKASQAGTIETDQKYIEFLEKLEKEKNNVANSSGYFMETEGVSSKEAKVTTTPLLEFLKVRKQQKLELKLKRREAEKERRRKEDEVRKTEKLKKVKEKKTEEKVEPIAELKEGLKIKSDVAVETKDKKTDFKSPKPEKVIVKTRVFEKRPAPKEGVETSSRPRNQAEFKTKRDVESKKTTKILHKVSSTPTDEKTDEGPVDSSRKTNDGNKPAKKEDGDSRKEAKSKFRYSEQRNRERTQKSSKKEESKAPKEVKEKPEEDVHHEERRIRRQSTQDTSDGSVEGDDKSGEGKDDRNSQKQDPRVERRIRNKDRPAMQIYRPGMGRFSKQRIEQKKDDDASESDDKKSDRNRGERKKTDQAVDETVTKDDGEYVETAPSDEKVRQKNETDSVPTENESPTPQE